MGDAAEPLAQTERWVINACQELKLPVATADDDIFDAGGTSLTIIRLIARAEKEFGADLLSPDDIVESSSVRGIAASIRRNMAHADVAAANGS
jgi:acyl carrier protein